MKPRRSRIDAAGALHHVMVRGIERSKVFRSDWQRSWRIQRQMGARGGYRPLGAHSYSIGEPPSRATFLSLLV
jgi:hypothetical protein